MTTAQYSFHLINYFYVQLKIEGVEIKISKERLGVGRFQRLQNNFYLKNSVYALHGKDKRGRLVFVLVIKYDGKSAAKVQKWN